MYVSPCVDRHSRPLTPWLLYQHPGLPETAVAAERGRKDPGLPLGWEGLASQPEPVQPSARCSCPLPQAQLSTQAPLCLCSPHPVAALLLTPTGGLPCWASPSGRLGVASAAAGVLRAPLGSNPPTQARRGLRLYFMILFCFHSNPTTMKNPRPREVNKV